MSDRQPRRIDVSVEVPGTPEQVWEAIATGPGITSWFVPHEVEEREGGAVRMDFGAGFGEETARVRAWEPPGRLLVSAEGERALAFEWLVQARDGGGCVVRLVNTGFGPGEDWDADFDGMSEGWPIFLANLRLHLEHFPGQSARAVIPTGVVPGEHPQAFLRLCAALGVSPDLQPGDPFVTTGEGVPPVSGHVQDVRRGARTTTYFLLLDAPAPGTAVLTAERAGELSAVSFYLYLYGPAAASLPDVWTPWFAERFPLPGGAPTPAP